MMGQFAGLISSAGH